MVAFSGSLLWEAIHSGSPEAFSYYTTATTATTISRLMLLALPLEPENPIIMRKGHYGVQASRWGQSVFGTV